VIYEVTTATLGPLHLDHPSKSKPFTPYGIISRTSHAMPCSARPYTSNTEPPTTIPAVGQVTPRRTPAVCRAELGGGARAPGRSVPRGGKGNFPSLRGWGKLPLPTQEPETPGAAGTPGIQGDCLAGGLPTEALCGCGRPYARQRAWRTLPAAFGWPGLPQGSPHQARSRGVAKKSPSQAPETHPTTRGT
jgi:hypothetical protein